LALLHGKDELIASKDEMLEALTKEPSLAKTTMEKKEIELSPTKSSMVDLVSQRCT
jgi:hypothetical protein